MVWYFAYLNMFLSSTLLSNSEDVQFSIKSFYNFEGFASLSSNFQIFCREARSPSQFNFWPVVFFLEIFRNFFCLWCSKISQLWALLWIFSFLLLGNQTGVSLWQLYTGVSLFLQLWKRFFIIFLWKFTSLSFLFLVPLLARVWGSGHLVFSLLFSAKSVPFAFCFLIIYWFSMHSYLVFCIHWCFFSSLSFYEKLFKYN